MQDLKRIGLLLLSVMVTGFVCFQLWQSRSTPQVQSRLDLAQSALILQASEGAPGPQQELLNQVLQGQSPVVTALSRYQEAIASAEDNLEQLQQRQADPLAASLGDGLGNELVQQRLELVQLRLEAGVLAAQQDDLALAQSYWQAVVQDQPAEAAAEGTAPALAPPPLAQTLAQTLDGLWQASPRLLPDAEQTISDGLKGWFRDQSLARLFTLDQRQGELASLEAARQATATTALTRLAVVLAIPGLGISLGSLLLAGVAFLSWRRRRQPDAPLRLAAWTVPWSGEITWIGLGVGFLLIGQLLVSALAGGLIFGTIQALNPSNPILAKAIGVFLSYGAMAIAVLGFLVWLLRPYRPLGPDWFRLSLRGGNWFGWGLGGYFAAYPLVLLVSTLNAQIWQGRGGSNPLLTLALENRDRLALLFFFVTAAIAAPVFEEIFFRGFLMTSLTQHLPPWGAVVASAAIFALVHLSLSEVLPLMTLGIVLGAVYGRSRNLLASILLHSLWNSGTLISLFLLGGAVA